MAAHRFLVLAVLLALAGCGNTSAARPAEPVAAKTLADLTAAGTVQGDFTEIGDQLRTKVTRGTFSRTATGDLRLTYTRSVSTQRDKPDRLIEYEVLRVGDSVYAKSASYKMPAGKAWLRLSSLSAGATVGVTPALWALDPKLILGGMPRRSWAPDQNPRKPGGFVADPRETRSYRNSWSEEHDDASDPALPAWHAQAFKPYSVTASLIVEASSSRLMQLGVSASTNPTVPGVSLTANYTKFGDPVDIAAPPADQVIGQ